MSFSPVLYTKRSLASVQEYSLLCARTFRSFFTPPIYWGDIFTQMDSIGFGSLPIVILTGFFTGCVLALQSASALQQFGAVNKTPSLVSLSMVKELGPVLTGLMVSGRNASGIASELGSMKVTEQVDAMRALGTDPVRKLVAPRVFATVFMLEFLSILSAFMGIIGGWIVCVGLLGLKSSFYFHETYFSLYFADVWQGLTKPVFFGYIIATVGCYFGITTSGGTQGVGKSTTRAVVMSSVMIIIVDFLLTKLLIGIFGR